MIIKSNKLLSELITLVNSHIEFAKHLTSLQEEKLQKKVNPKSWSVLECIEHLNLYAEFYNQEIVKRLKNTPNDKEENFKSGYLGNKFSLDMIPKEGMKTMNTFKSKNPIYSKLKKETVLNQFLTYQEELLDLLEISKNKNLNKIKTSITLPLLKFKLGDTLRFIIYHNLRHIEQAKRALSNNL